MEKIAMEKIARDLLHQEIIDLKESLRKKVQKQEDRDSNEEVVPLRPKTQRPERG